MWIPSTQKPSNVFSSCRSPRTTSKRFSGTTVQPITAWWECENRASRRPDAQEFNTPLLGPFVVSSWRPSQWGGIGAQSPYRLSVLRSVHVAVRHRQGKRVLHQSRSRCRTHSDAHLHRAPGGLERQHQFLYLAPVGYFGGGIRPASGGRFVALQRHTLGVGDQQRDQSRTGFGRQKNRHFRHSFFALLFRSRRI